METAVTVLQLIIGFGILNVWLLRFGKSTSYRGGNAQNLKDEFEVYGLPEWFMKVVGFLKITFAVMLIAGVWVPALTKPAAIGMAFLMLGAVAMHIKVKDPAQKALPALTLLVCAVIVAGVSSF